MNTRRWTKQANLPLTLAITALLLLLTDVGLHNWNLRPQRLPEHFSSSYLARYVHQFQNTSDLLVIVGDSVLWGYGVSDRDSAVAVLRRRFPKTPILNLSYEAGTPINVDFLLRYILAQNIRPRAVLFDLNPISFNQTTKSYDTLNTALDRLCVPALLASFDTGKLNVDQSADRKSNSEKTDRFVEDHWLLYGLRVDMHQTLFGDVDASTALWSHTVGRESAQPAGSYDRMYDLTPLDIQNISYAYTEHSFAMLSARHIPALGFLTPTNHKLVHDYVDVAAYDQNLIRLQHLGRRYGVSVMNFDRLFAAPSFIDNTHLTRYGNHKLADALSSTIVRKLHVF